MTNPGPDLLRFGVELANQITDDLRIQSTVTFQKMVISTDGYTSKTYPTSVPLKAIVDWKQKQIRTTLGVLSVSRASVLFLDVAKLLAATNGEGIDDNDRIILPDGTTGPILDMAGFIDSGTGIPIATEVFLG